MSQFSPQHIWAMVQRPGERRRRGRRPCEDGMEAEEAEDGGGLRIRSASVHENPFFGSEAGSEDSFGSPPQRAGGRRRRTRAQRDEEEVDPPVPVPLQEAELPYPRTLPFASSDEESMEDRDGDMEALAAEMRARVEEPPDGGGGGGEPPGVDEEDMQYWGGVDGNPRECWMCAYVDLEADAIEAPQIRQLVEVLNRWGTREGYESLADRMARTFMQIVYAQARPDAPPERRRVMYGHMRKAWLTCLRNHRILHGPALVDKIAKLSVLTQVAFDSVRVEKASGICIDQEALKSLQSLIKLDLLLRKEDPEKWVGARGQAGLLDIPTTAQSTFAFSTTRVAAGRRRQRDAAAAADFAQQQIVLGPDGALRAQPRSPENNGANV